MNILFIVHAKFEKPGYFDIWAKNNKHSTNIVSPYMGENIPQIDNYDMLIVMGGPQSPLEMDQAPYLVDEINVLKIALQQNKKVIGVCLGAQLIAEALGAKTERSPNKEIGAYEIELYDKAKDDPVFKNFPQKFTTMHWHSDMPGIPEGAELLAKSKGCPRQVFRYGDRVYAFQCHFEFTQEETKEMIDNCKNDLAQCGEFIASQDKLLEADFSKINSKLKQVLEYLAHLPDVKWSKMQ